MAAKNKERVNVVREKVDGQTELANFTFVKTILMLSIVFYHSIILWRGGGAVMPIAPADEAVGLKILTQLLADYFPTIVLSAVMSLSVYAVSLIDLSAFWVLVLQLTAGVSVYLILSWVFKVEQFKFITTFVLSKIRKTGKKSEEGSL